MPKYHSISTIPAKVFFSILKSKDYQQLKPKPREKGLEQVFMDIYDNYFLLSDNYESKEYLRVTVELAKLEYKKATLMQIMHLYFNYPITKGMIDSLKVTLKKVFQIDLDLSKPLLNEIERIVTIEKGIIENDIVILKTDFDRMVKDSQTKAMEFTDELASLGQVLQGNNLVREGVMLDTYISLTKTAKKMVEQQNKKVK